MHRRTWLEHYHPLLVSSGPDQNFVQVLQNWIDLEEKIENLQADEVKAQRIADNSAAVFRDRYLTPAAQVCYWRRLFKGWAEVSFEPDLHHQDGSGNWKRRGTPYETFMWVKIFTFAIVLTG